MGFFGYKERIEEGDLVLAHVKRNNIQAFIAEHGKILNNRFGTYSHDDIIGQRYGTQIPSKQGRGFIYVLHPTPKLWSESLPHRTQIIYAPDASYIVARLGLTPGKTIIEAGTGSGALTHNFATSVSQSGHVYTYETNSDRFNAAQAEFEAHKLTDVVTLTYRNVCVDGFGIDDVKFCADCVFLDMPNPWEAIPLLYDCIAKKAILCCFVPCIEQVQKTLETLRSEQWFSTSLVDLNYSSYEPRVIERKTIHDAEARLKYVKQKRKVLSTDTQNKDSVAEPAYDNGHTEIIAIEEPLLRSHTGYLIFANFRAQ